MITQRDLVNTLLRNYRDDMRLMRHPAKEWEQERMYGRIEVASALGGDPELLREVREEAHAMLRDKPAKPYKRTNKVAETV